MGHRGLVGLFVNNKFIRCQGSRDRIPVFPSFNQRFFVYSKYNSFELIRFMWPTTLRLRGTPGETRWKDRQAFQEEDARKEYLRFVSRSGRYKNVSNVSKNHVTVTVKQSSVNQCNREIQ